jgi:acetyl-CoA carboxylase biotin carboxyl carrier protein
MDLNDIKALIETMAASDLTDMEYSENGWTIRLTRDSGRARSPAMTGRQQRQAPHQPASDQTASDHPSPEQDDLPAVAVADLRSPLPGLVHLRPSPDAPPFVLAGQTVKAGDTVCLIEAMKVFNSVRAERAGTIAAVLVTNGSEVEAGQTLMRIV